MNEFEEQRGMALDASSPADADVPTAAVAVVLAIEEDAGADGEAEQQTASVSDRRASMTPSPTSSMPSTTGIAPSLAAPAAIAPSPAAPPSPLPPAASASSGSRAGDGAPSYTMSSTSAPAGLPKREGSVSSSNLVGEGQELWPGNFTRTLSGSKLNAEAPAFVPKGISSPSLAPAAVAAPRLLSTGSLPIPGVLPIHFLDPGVPRLYGDLSSSMVPGAPSVAALAATVSQAPEMDDGFPALMPSPPLAHLAAPHHHAPHPKSVNNEEIRAKIVKQVEFYFSNQNLPTDHNLMKFVKKDPEGFVPIHIVASFRRVKGLSKSVGVITSALRNSSSLVVSEDGKKVRRAQPLPEVDLEEVQSRTVVAENLPADHSIESMEQLFGSIGAVKMVRICQPEAANGASQTAAKFKSDMVVSNKLHALVEFQTIEQAEKAVSALSDQGNWRSGLRVRLLLRRTFHQSKHGLQKCRRAGVDEGGEHDEMAGTEDRNGDELHQLHDEASGQDGAGLNERDGVMRRGKGRGRGRGGVGRGKGQHGPHHVGANGRGTHHLGTSPHAAHPVIPCEVVSRLPPGPRMPDGTRGFTLGRGRVPVAGSA